MPCVNAKREKVGMRKKVMIVEDNELNLKLFTDLLRAHQFTVEGVRDGRLALERAKLCT
jgi:two-component system cell cycle response regulator DivK